MKSHSKIQIFPSKGYSVGLGHDFIKRETRYLVIKDPYKIKVKYTSDFHSDGHVVLPSTQCMMKCFVLNKKANQNDKVN